MVEGTGGIEFLLPVILSIVLSNWVAHHVHSAGAYESDLERIGKTSDFPICKETAGIESHEIQPCLEILFFPILLPSSMSLINLAHALENNHYYKFDGFVFLEAGEVHFLQSEPSQKLHLITARDIMASDVISFKEVTNNFNRNWLSYVTALPNPLLVFICTLVQSQNGHSQFDVWFSITFSTAAFFIQITSVAEIVEVLRETSHNGFPIIRHTHRDVFSSDGQLVGVILRHQVLLLLEQRCIFEADALTLNRRRRHSCSLRLPKSAMAQQYLERLMGVYHHAHYPHRRYLSSRPEAVNELEIDELLQVSHFTRDFPFVITRRGDEWLILCHSS